MTTTSPESLALLGRAAELRASGIPWADAAAQLAVVPDELRRLASEHGRDYDRLLRRARAEALREALDAALTALRTHVGSPDPRLSFLAATTIVRYDLARMRHGRKEADRRLAERPGRERGQVLEPLGPRQKRDKNASESPKVPNQQEVTAAKNVAQSPAPHAAPRVPPAPSRPTPPAPASPTPPVAARPAPVAGKNQAPPDDAARRRLRLVDAFARGRTPAAPLARGKRLDLEVDRLLTGWLAES